MMNTKKSLMMGTAVVLTNGSLDHEDAKTAHGLIRGSERFEITGVIDHNSAGRDAGEVLDGVHRNIPVFSDIAAYLSTKGKKPDYAIIGVALSGGRLDEQWLALTLDIIQKGISIVNGMHMLLGDNPVLLLRPKKIKPGLSMFAGINPLISFISGPAISLT